MKLIGVKNFSVRGIRMYSNKEDVIDQIGSTVILEREPDNTYDSNAIEVYLEEAGEKIGYISQEEAANLAPVLDDYNSEEFKILTYRARLVDVIDSMTAIIEVKFYYDNQRHVDLYGNTYGDLKSILGF